MPLGRQELRSRRHRVSCVAKSLCLCHAPLHLQGVRGPYGAGLLTRILSTPRHTVSLPLSPRALPSCLKSPAWSSTPSTPPAAWFLGRFLPPPSQLSPALPHLDRSDSSETPTPRALVDPIGASLATQPLQPHSYPLKSSILGLPSIPATAACCFQLLFAALAALPPPLPPLPCLLLNVFPLPRDEPADNKWPPCPTTGGATRHILLRPRQKKSMPSPAEADLCCY